MNRIFFKACLSYVLGKETFKVYDSVGEYRRSQLSISQLAVNIVVIIDFVTYCSFGY